MRGTPIVKYQYVNPHLKRLIQATALVFLFATGWMVGVINVMQHNAKPMEKVIYKIALMPLEEYDSMGPSIEFGIPTIEIHPRDRHRLEYRIEDGPTNELIEASLDEFEWKPESFEDEIVCLAKNIYFEAKSEDMIGRIAVGNVTINRVKDSDFPNTVCGVVWEKRIHPNTKKWVAQFSWTWDGKNDDPSEADAWEESLTLASAMLAEGSLDNFVDITDGADHYHALYVKPYWRNHMQVATTIGAHRFYISENPGI